MADVECSIAEKEKELYAFDDLKVGVKGLSDSGVTKIPRIFIHPPETVKNTAPANGVKLQIPVIDLKGIGKDHGREEMVNAVKDACETWGFFQIVNHGVPLAVMGEMLQGICKFHEQPVEDKMDLYSRDHKNQVNIYCSGDLKVRAKSAADWRDTLFCRAVDDKWDSGALPEVCRREISEYIKNLIQLQNLLSKLLSEALGLSKDHLAHMGCLKSFSLSCHYYPIFPEPELTLGTIKRSDPSFLTLVLQDNIGGFQVLHKDQWVDVPPVDGAFVANLGDFMQNMLSYKPSMYEVHEIFLVVIPHYYPVCRKPKLTLGTIKNSDPSYLTLLLQDKDQWVGVPPVDGAFVANLGDFMHVARLYSQFNSTITQLVTNNKFKSTGHTPTPLVKPQISVASNSKSILSLFTGTPFMENILHIILNYCIEDVDDKKKN